MGQLWQTIRPYVGPVLLGIGALGVVGAVFLTFGRLTDLGSGKINVTTLPLLAIGGVVVLILMLTVVAMIFSVLGLTNQGQAMGLPEGSIRAVIALSLIVLFAILSVFLYQGVSENGTLNKVENLSEVERAQFLRDHATARDLQSVRVMDKNGEPVVVKDRNDQPVRNSDGSPKYLYNVSFRSTNTTSDDFAKQLLVLLGTLMTAVTSFYLGAGTATSAAAAGQTTAAANPPPTISGISPTTHNIADSGPILKLTVMGANLNVIINVKIARGGQTLIGTNVASSPTRVTCDIDVSGVIARGQQWDVAVDDGGSLSVSLPGVLTIN